MNLLMIKGHNLVHVQFGNPTNIIDHVLVKSKAQKHLRVLILDDLNFDEFVMSSRFHI